MLDRNGKKELVREAITRVLRQSIGVRFEVELAPEGETPGAAPNAGAAAPEAPAPSAPRRNGRTGSPEVNLPAVAPVPAQPVVKLTPELIESIRDSEPLVKALMDELGASIIKVE